MFLEVKKQAQDLKSVIDNKQDNKNKPLKLKKYKVQKKKSNTNMKT